MAAEDALLDEEDGEDLGVEIVEWYDARPMTVSTARAAGAVVCAFALGVAVGVAAVVLADRLDL